MAGCCPQPKQDYRSGRPSLETLRPRRMRRRHVVRRCRAAFDHTQAVAGVCRHELARWRRVHDPVPRHHRHQDRPGRVRREQPGDAGEYRVVIAQDAPQQRSPRKMHGQRRGQATQCLRWVLGRCDDEERVRQAAFPSRAARRPGHRRCAGVYPDDQRVRLLGRHGQHMFAVTSAKIDGYATITVGEASKMAGVELVDAVSSNHAEHDTTLTRKRSARRSGFQPSGSQIRFQRLQLHRPLRRACVGPVLHDCRTDGFRCGTSAMGGHMRSFVSIVACLGVGTFLVACQAGKTAPASSPVATPASAASASPASSASTGTPASPRNSPSTVSIQNAICAAVYHGGVQGGRCRATDVKVSVASPACVYARVGVYNAAGQLNSDDDQVMLNLTTHEVIGPTNVGFCGAGLGGGRPVGGYGAVPSVVLASLGLSPCTSSGATSGAPQAGTSATTGRPTSMAAFAATWRAHDMLLVITSAGAGHLTYADLRKCPSCSLGSAPASTLDFVLTSVINGVAAGRVTASSDLKNWALALPVQVVLAAGSPGQLLNVKIGGKQLVAFCTGTSAGQCGA